MRFAVLSILILGAGGLVIGLSLTRPDETPAPIVQPAAPSQGATVLQSGSTTLGPDGTLNLGSSPFSTGTTPVTTPGSTPAPWEYNAATNQHWDPNHGHWHSGRPPADKVTGPAPATGTTAPTTPATTPKAWEYNPDTNQHWDPNHGHWHSGPAPAGKVVGKP